MIKATFYMKSGHVFTVDVENLITRHNTDGSLRSLDWTDVNSYAARCLSAIQTQDISAIVTQEELED